MLKSSAENVQCVSKYNAIYYESFKILPVLILEF